MRVLITGGSGFLGSFVIEELHRRGHSVVALARSRAAADRVGGLGATALIGDLDRPADLKEVFADARADALVNVASLGFGHAPTVIAAAGCNDLRRAVFLSTTAIFTSLPAASKQARTEAELAIESSDLDWTIIRPTMIYGAPGDRNMERLLKLLRWCPIVPLPAGGRGATQTVHVADLAWFVVTALESDTIRRSFNVAGPESLPLRSAVAQASTALGRRRLLVPVPLGPVRKGVRAYERRVSSPRLKEEQVLRLEEDKSFSIDDATALGYRPRSFAQGVRDEVATLGL
jgi:uncharacterized protein YbjT (DUF2867 family)